MSVWRTMPTLRWPSALCIDCRTSTDWCCVTSFAFCRLV
jgi:hypothetical protein